MSKKPLIQLVLFSVNHSKQKEKRAFSMLQFCNRKNKTLKKIQWKNAII